MLASTKGRSDFVRELLVHEADVNAEDADNWTALLCAAKEGHLDICLQLIEHGSEIEHRDMVSVQVVPFCENFNFLYISKTKAAEKILLSPCHENCNSHILSKY